MPQVTHFVGVGCYDQKYWNAVWAFEPPISLHQRWDRRAQREIADGDVVVFAEGDADQPLSRWNGDDEYYC